MTKERHRLGAELDVVIGGVEDAEEVVAVGKEKAASGG